MFFIILLEKKNGHFAQVVTKVIKHAWEAPSSTAHNLLLGLDLDASGILEVSNFFSFALLHHAGNEDEKSVKATGIQEFLNLVVYLLNYNTCQHDIMHPCYIH